MTVVHHLPSMARGWTPERAGCSGCGASISLDEHPHSTEGLTPGERAYRCGLCSQVTIFYSAAWLLP